MADIQVQSVSYTLRLKFDFQSFFFVFLFFCRAFFRLHQNTKVRKAG